MICIFILNQPVSQTVPDDAWGERQVFTGKGSRLMEIFLGMGASALIVSQESMDCPSVAIRLRAGRNGSRGVNVVTRRFAHR